MNDLITKSKQYLFQVSILFIFIVIWLSGCTTPMHFVNKEYTFDPNNAAIAILPLTSDAMRISNYKDLKVQFKSDNRSPFLIIADTGYKYIVSGIVDSIQIKCFVLPSSFCLNWKQDTTHYFSFKMNFIHDSLPTNFNVLKKEYFKPLFPDANLALTINMLSTNTIAGTSGGMVMWGGFNGGMMMGGGGGSYPSLESTVRYIIWDYDKNEVVSCGDIVDNAGFLFYQTKDTWLELFRSIGQNLLSQTPFKIPNN